MARILSSISCRILGLIFCAARFHSCPVAFITWRSVLANLRNHISWDGDRTSRGESGIPGSTGCWVGVIGAGMGVLDGTDVELCWTPVDWERLAIVWRSRMDVSELMSKGLSEDTEGGNWACALCVGCKKRFLLLTLNERMFGGTSNVACPSSYGQTV